MNKKKDLPQVLLLKKKYLYNFPNGQSVGLYYSDHLNQYITVMVENSPALKIESIINTLHGISEKDETDTVVFEDTSELNINKECADLVLNYIEKNQELLESISTSEGSFLEILKQASEALIESDEEPKEISDQ